MTDKKIIEEDMVNAKDFCPYYSCQVDCYEARMCPWFVDTLQQLKRKEDLINEIEDIIEPYQTEIEAEAFSLPTAIESILKRKEQECERLRFPMPDTNYAILTKEEFEQLNQLKQALKEIKEVAKELLQTKIPFCTIHEKIMEIINEVENG